MKHDGPSRPHHTWGGDRSLSYAEEEEEGAEWKNCREIVQWREWREWRERREGRGQGREGRFGQNGRGWEVREEVGREEIRTSEGMARRMPSYRSLEMRVPIPSAVYSSWMIAPGVGGSRCARVTPLSSASTLCLHSCEVYKSYGRRGGEGRAREGWQPLRKGTVV